MFDIVTQKFFLNIPLGEFALQFQRACFAINGLAYGKQIM